MKFSRSHEQSLDITKTNRIIGGILKKPQDTKETRIFFDDRFFPCGITIQFNLLISWVPGPRPAA